MATSKLNQAAGKQSSAVAVKGEEDNKATALAVASDNAVALADGGIDFESDAGQGLEGADKDSFALPFLVQLQGLSPQLKTVEGARPGMFYNTITGALSKELRVIPVAFQRRYNRWVPRAQGGGFRGTMTVAEVESLMAAKQTREEKNQGGGTDLMYEDTVLKDTRNHFVLTIDEDGNWSPALISLASTQIKRSKRWVSLIQNFQMTGKGGKRFNPPSYAVIYKVTSETERNEKGEWESFAFATEGPVSDQTMYQAAKELHELVTTGAIQAAPPPEGADNDAAPGGEGQSTSGKF